MTLLFLIALALLGFVMKLVALLLLAPILSPNSLGRAHLAARE